MQKILSLKWIEQGSKYVLISAKIVEVSKKSAELNLSVWEGSQYPKYAPASDVKKYLVEKEATASNIEKDAESDTETVAEKPKEKTVKNEKPVFKTVEEKRDWETAQKNKE